MICRFFLLFSPHRINSHSACGKESSAVGDVGVQVSVGFVEIAAAPFGFGEQRAQKQLVIVVDGIFALYYQCAHWKLDFFGVTSTDVSE